MNEQQEMLEVVDEQDNIIGLETREKVHKEGLLHREINIWFITPMGEIIFQHRAKSKDTAPDKLAATVGGHVDPKMSYEATAIKECYEETGLRIQPENLIFSYQIHKNPAHKTSGSINNCIRSHYLYFYNGDIKDLKIEQGEGIGFEAWSIDNILQLAETDKSKFVQSVFSREMISMFQKAKQLLLAQK